ncbi:unnamed protein product [Clonostachys rosea]|uniref:Uncharacterized protein n=1 Tax=Bionectria ochroleuca TaxID=29856 RepID=A0ABY6TZU3_BIOOC|nr:unnamed protein product [Clonostachys rosea]
MDSSTKQKFEAYSMQLRAAIDEVAEKGDEESLLNTISSSINNITSQLSHVSAPHHDEVEVHIHNLWYACIQAAKSMDAGGYLQDALLRQIQTVKTLTPLQPPSNRGSTEPAFSDGYTAWSSLPLFAQDLINEFTSRYYKRGLYSFEQHRNLAGFLGRLVSVGIYDGPALCMLSLFRETLEVSRPLAANPDSKEIPLDELLPALGQLIGDSGFGISTLVTNCPVVLIVSYPELSSLGELASRSGGIPSSGYSPERWRFWIQRLEELSKSGVAQIEHDAKLFHDWMIGEQDTTGLPHIMTTK